ncbi:MAG TPA: hypothetical protein VIL82_03960 [Solirubrobacteraceae bacterium]|jgi:hypothetical protein
MLGPNVFISSCSRRQLARRRPARFPVGQLGGAVLAVMLVLALAAFALGHGGI